MSNKQKQPQQEPAAAIPQGSINIPYPLLWLTLASLLLYFPTFSFGLTELDDIIFIRDFAAYFSDWHNLITSFQRGLFDAVKDPYYRPLFLDSMLLNYHISDEGQNIISYHVINVLFHIITVGLLFSLLKKLNLKELHAFILALLFAVLPVLSQAVAWIPGRNDTMLAIFILSYFIFAIDYAHTGKVKHILLSSAFLILSFFTKETAVFAPPAAFLLLVLVLRKNWRDKNSLIQYGVWAACFAIWYIARSQATTTSSGISTDIIHRLPVIIQYLGKVFFPFNLSVFPEQRDTVYYYGIVAIALLTALIYLNRKRDWRTIAAGLLLFLLFLMPALLVPHELNKQMFEHRLYLPAVGILIILSQTVLVKNNLTGKQLLTAGLAICGLFAFVNLRHQKNFEDPITFWTQATETTPNSGYAKMMLAARLGDQEFERSSALFRTAYQLDPKEKYINFYYAVMLQKKDSVMQSEPYLLAEKKISGYYECDFYLARIAMEKRDLNGAITYLQDYLKTDTHSKIAHTNLLLLYLDTQQKDKALAQVKHMQQLGIAIPPGTEQRLNTENR